MPTLLLLSTDGSVQLSEAPAPDLDDRAILVRNRHSAVSIGTELSGLEVARQSVLRRAASEPHLASRVLGKLRAEGVAGLIRAVRPVASQLGYSCAGEVLEVGAGLTDLVPGDLVACGGAGYASHSEIVAVPRNLCARIPDGVSTRAAAFTTLGAIAMQGVRLGEVTVGDRVLVIGLGIIGQLAVQIATAAGTRVLAVDLDPRKVELARSCGASAGCGAGPATVAQQVEAFTGGFGVDVVLICAATKSSGPLELAAQVARDRGKVVVVGAVGMNAPRDPFYMKELSLRVSRSYGPGRYDPYYEEKGIDYPIGYVRWTEGRNMEGFLELLALGRVNVEPITTHVCPFDDAPALYAEMTNRSGTDSQLFVGVLLEYKAGAEPSRRVELAPAKRPRKAVCADGVRIGLIGAGSFTRGTLLPILRSTPEVSVRAVATRSGQSGRTVADELGSAYCTTDYSEILDDPEIDALVVATGHETHAEIAQAAFRANKPCYLEKPLAITPDQLDEVESAYAEHGGFVQLGFNRRFAPCTQRVLEHLSDYPDPRTVVYRCAAGEVHSTSWQHDPERGGGRVIGEACHFVDLAGMLTGSTPVRVYAEQVTDSGKATQDDVVITIRYADGSVANVLYLAMASPGVGKERIEVFCNGVAALIDDFRAYALSEGSASWRPTRLKAQDKGHAAALRAFIDAVREGAESPVPFAESVTTTRVTFAVLQALRSGAPVSL